MANHSWSSGDWNFRNAYFSNSMTSPESSEMRHHLGSTMYWSSEEQAILEHGLVRYSAEPSISRYAKIALELQNNKTIRDIAMRCRWMHTKENNKRRKEDHTVSGRARVDNQEVIDMVVARNSAAHLFASSHLLREVDGITSELLKQNEQLLSRISANLTNLTSLKLTENLTLFNESRKNIRKLLINLSENAPEQMKHMPPWPEKLRDDQDQLLDSILPPSHLQ
ncbi:hypothetical protein Rs2_10195 [Raphanus sativus]|uniref:Uncharacterized protein LOC108846834 n=1 Tax=Raphanus sativus TaxID=3726 RepID=A0A6J0MST9_RAPSA|nr:uncharacterized protein LOC108846834 [Raphanus sativus]XP_056857692.1 uncharacterized protein LOC130507009 [Raphanus sativus]KAJ4866326.1 hypothetical protein Rs2_52150 [Raphanus sativus]KAJ4906537.1 hypothetical protein Rs2_10195 [Raphanus sativus]